MSETRFDPTAWSLQSWTNIKKAARLRGIEARDIKGLSESEKEAHTKAVREELISWYKRWGTEAKYPPEMLELEDLVAEARLMGLTIPDRLEGRNIKELTKTVVDMHVEKHRTEANIEDELYETVESDEDEFDSDDEERPSFSHVSGIPGLKKAGRCRTHFPLRSLDASSDDPPVVVSSNITSVFGLVLLAHKSGYGYPLFKDRSPCMIQKTRVITGLTLDSRPESIKFECFAPATGLLAGISKEELLKLGRFSCWSEAFDACVGSISPSLTLGGLTCFCIS